MTERGMTEKRMTEERMTEERMTERGMTEKKRNESIETNKSAVLEKVYKLFEYIDIVDDADQSGALSSNNKAEYKLTRSAYMEDLEKFYTELGTLLTTISDLEAKAKRKYFTVDSKTKNAILYASLDFNNKCKTVINQINVMINRMEDIIYMTKRKNKLDKYRASQVWRQSKSVVATKSEGRPVEMEESDSVYTSGGKKSKKRRRQSKQTKRRQHKINKQPKLKYTIRRR